MPEYKHNFGMCAGDLCPQYETRASPHGDVPSGLCKITSCFVYGFVYGPEKVSPTSPCEVYTKEFLARFAAGDGLYVEPAWRKEHHEWLTVKLAEAKVAYDQTTWGDFERHSALARTIGHFTLALNALENSKKLG